MFSPRFFSYFLVFFLFFGCFQLSGYPQEHRSSSNTSAVPPSLNATQAAGGECRVDSDCVHAPSCCHPMAQPCIAKTKAKSLLNCKGVMCTMECRPCTECRCISGKCVAVEIKGGCC